MTKKFINIPVDKRHSAPAYRNPARFRLDFIRENTFNRIWSIRMTRLRVIIVTAACVAALAALIWCTIVYTPIRNFIPGTLKGDTRAQYIETALRVDSLERAFLATETYISNLRAIMKGETDTVVPTSAVVTPSTDSLAGASEAERDFVQRYEQEQRFKLSVLAPIAAEGMVFSSPRPASAPEAMSSVYRGNVISVCTTADGLSTIIIQHPNDFVSVYSGLGDVFVRRGSKVAAGQRIGHATKGSETSFELWHKGALLDPDDYLTL